MGTGKNSSEATDDLDDMPLAERRSLIRLRKAASPLSRVPEPPKCFLCPFSAYALFCYFLGRVTTVVMICRCSIGGPAARVSSEISKVSSDTRFCLTLNTMQCMMGA